MELKNKTVLITGSTDGLGKTLAVALVKTGAEVIIHGRDSEKVNATVSEVGASDGLVCDFNNPDDIPDVFGKIKNLDILINNAGMWFEGNTLDIAPEKIIELINVDITSHIVATRTLLPTLLRSEFGQILNVVSVAGIEIPFDYYHTVYSAAKFGMQGFSEAMAKEFDNKNLRVMGFYPGGMETGIFKKAGNAYKPREPWMFDPKEAADAVIFMLTRNPKVNIKRLDLINHLEK